MPHTATATASANGWTVLVIACPAPVADSTPGLTQCDRDCLTLLAQAAEPLSGVCVRRELEKRGIGVWGLITVKRSLAKLRRLGLVSNARKGARGYFLPEAAPLLGTAG